MFSTLSFDLFSTLHVLSWLRFFQDGLPVASHQACLHVSDGDLYLHISATAVGPGGLWIAMALLANTPLPSFFPPKETDISADDTSFMNLVSGKYYLLTKLK